MLELTQKQSTKLLALLKARFEKNLIQNKDLNWDRVVARLKSNPDKLSSLYLMEDTGGEPALVEYDRDTDKFIFFDCSPESPGKRRNYCYDYEAQLSSLRRVDKNAVDEAKRIGIDLLTPEQYKMLQGLGDFDVKSTSWLKTSKEMRSIGGALFGDCFHGQTFIYHNSAQSAFTSRGFRGFLKV